MEAINTLNLYQITEQYRLIENQLIESEGDLTPELEELLLINEENRDEAVRNFFYLMIEKEDELEALKARIDHLTDLQKRKKKTHASFKKALARAVETFGELKVDEFKLKTRESKSCITDGLDADLQKIQDYLKDRKLTDIIENHYWDEDSPRIHYPKELKTLCISTGLSQDRIAEISMLIDDKYITQSVELSLSSNKTDLKKYLKDKTLDGAFIQVNKNLSVK